MRPGIALLLSSLLITGFCAAQSPDVAKPKLASEVYKNLRLLGDVPASQWFSTMSFFADSLGVTCDHCHARNFDSDEKPAKITARQMIAMTAELNQKYFPDKPAVITCNSCHHGTLKPAATPIPDLDHWLSASRAKEPLPPASELIARYRKLLGPAGQMDSRSQKATVNIATYPMGGSIVNVSSEIVVGGTSRAHVVSSSERGSTTLVHNGDKGWINDGTGWKPMNAGQTFSLRNELAALQADDLADTSDAVTVGRQHVLESEAYVVEAKAGQLRAQLFFDTKSGLLLRRRNFLPAYFGDHTWQVEYAQYRQYANLLLPDVVRVINPAGSGLTIRTVTRRKMDPKLDPKLFLEPH